MQTSTDARKKEWVITFHTFIRRLQICMQILPTRLNAKQVPIRYIDHALASPRAPWFHLGQNIERTAGVEINWRAPANVHSTVKSWRDEDELIMFARHVECLSLTEVFGTHWNKKTTEWNTFTFNFADNPRFTNKSLKKSYKCLKHYDVLIKKQIILLRNNKAKITISNFIKLSFQ